MGLNATFHIKPRLKSLSASRIIQILSVVLVFCALTLPLITHVIRSATMATDSAAWSIQVGLPELLQVFYAQYLSCPNQRGESSPFQLHLLSVI